MHKCKRPSAIAVLIIAAVCPAVAIASTVVGSESRQNLAVTIYQNGLSFVKDTRKLALIDGQQSLVLEDVSEQILPSSVMISAPGAARFSVIEQNFEKDVLSRNSLLAAYLGKEIGVVRKNSEAAEPIAQKATVVAIHNGLLLDINGQIVSGDAYELWFPKRPSSLSTKPSLNAEVSSGASSDQLLQLAYLTQGLSWSADYTLWLDPETQTAQLKAWATVVNNSSMRFPRAQLRLVAGEVNTGNTARIDGLEMAPMNDSRVQHRAMASYKMSAPVEQSFSGYVFYRVDGVKDISAKQQKQVALFEQKAVPYETRYIAEPNHQALFYQRLAEPVISAPTIRLDVQPVVVDSLPKRLPQGEVKMYQPDQQGALQLLGIDSVDMGFPGDSLELSAGVSSDIEVRQTQQSFLREKAPKPFNNMVEVVVSTKFKNAKDSAVLIEFTESFPGDWKLQGDKPTDKTVRSATWLIEVPAKGTQTIVYDLQYKQ